jgi:hypothetical protein
MNSSLSSTPHENGATPLVQSYPVLQWIASLQRDVNHQLMSMNETLRSMRNNVASVVMLSNVSSVIFTISYSAISRRQDVSNAVSEAILAAVCLPISRQKLYNPLPALATQQSYSFATRSADGSPTQFRRFINENVDQDTSLAILHRISGRPDTNGRHHRQV